MVRLTEKYSLREASCCRVEVVKGGAGDFLAGFWSRAATEKVAPIFFFKKVSASVLLAKVLPKRAEKACPLEVLNSALIRTAASGTNPSISRSRSTIKRTATDCTRPAESPG